MLALSEPLTMFQRAYRRGCRAARTSKKERYATPINPATVMSTFRAQQQKGEGSKPVP